MAMTLEEARKRVQVCNGHIEPKQIGKNRWVCDNCGVGLTEDENNSSGFCHYFDPGNEKVCTVCNNSKHITDFYYRKGALDKRYSYCKECARSATAQREEKLQLNGRTRHIWLPTDLWNAVQRVKGRQTFRDFVIIAIRKEVEIRAQRAMLQKARDDIESKKPKANA